MTTLTPEMQKQARDLFDKVEAEIHALLETLLTQVEAEGGLGELQMDGTLSTVMTALHSVGADLIFASSTSPQGYMSAMKTYAREMSSLMASAAASAMVDMLTGKLIESKSKFFHTRSQCDCENCKRRRETELTAGNLDADLEAMLKSIFGPNVTIIPVPQDDEEPQKH